MTRKTIYVGVMTCDHADVFDEVLSLGSTDPNRVAEYALELLETWEVDNGLVDRCREQLKEGSFGQPYFRLETDDDCIDVRFEVKAVILDEGDRI